MPLAQGMRFGPYEILVGIGAGGMGEVYRARDTRLGRDVAIKVLPHHLPTDSDRAARFEREARALASLSHPHIGAIYGLEEATLPEGTTIVALVLELVEGPTLADRLSGGPLAMAEALRIARQIADAVEAAHERGIVHRDLKPANIKITPEGTAKVLDFGLAKLVGGSAVDVTLSLTPTAETQAGIILGTPCYMSPEQARGQPIDKRTDIWSFGSVLYEMLTGRAAFPGHTLSDTIAAILNHNPDWQLLPAALPTSVRTLLQRCLQKDSRQRLRDIGDARIELDSVSASREASLPEAGAPADSPTTRRPTWIRALALSGVVVGALALGFMAATWFGTRAAVPAGAVQMTVLLPAGVTLSGGPGRLMSLALSPDGRTLVVAGTDANGQRLYQRPVGRLEATPLAGTEGALSPFFSPDGAWIGFFADRRLRRVPASGGAAVDISPAIGYPAGASWGSDNRIVFACGYLSPLRIVNAGGGTPEPLTKVEAGVGHSYPEFLPGGRSLLFNEGDSIHALDLVTGRRKYLEKGISPRYTGSGHVTLSRGTTLLAAPFDAARLELTGPVVPVTQGVAVERGSGAVPHVAISRGGTLAYVPAARAYALVVISPDRSDRLLAEDPLLENPQFSPNGQRLVVARSRRAGEPPELWTYDLTGAAPASRLTSDGGRAPVWTPDGASITYSRPPPGERSGIYTRPADGRGDATAIVPLRNFHWLIGWNANGTLAYGMMEDPASDGVTRSSIFAIEGGVSRRVVGPGDMWGGRLSPDGRSLAYYSLESGYFEIYVTPFPHSGTRQLIAEGTDPVWSPDGSEIYYRSGSRLLAARIDRTSGVRVLSRRLVIEPFTPPLYDDYAIHRDGRTLALVRPAADASAREITVVLNWLAEVQRLTRK